MDLYPVVENSTMDEQDNGPKMLTWVIGFALLAGPGIIYLYFKLGQLIWNTIN